MNTGTSLIGIAGIFVGVGGTLLATNVLAGSILLGIAAAILVVKAVLDKKGIVAKKSK
jgi:hypothetical protein